MKKFFGKAQWPSIYAYLIHSSELLLIRNEVLLLHRVDTLNEF